MVKRLTYKSFSPFGEKYATSSIKFNGRREGYFWSRTNAMQCSQCIGHKDWNICTVISWNIFGKHVGCFHHEVKRRKVTASFFHPTVKNTFIKIHVRLEVHLVLQLVPYRNKFGCLVNRTFECANPTLLKKVVSVIHTVPRCAIFFKSMGFKDIKYDILVYQM